MLLFFQLSGPGATTGYVFGDRGRTDEVITAFALDKVSILYVVELFISFVLVLARL